MPALPHRASRPVKPFAWAAAWATALALLPPPTPSQALTVASAPLTTLVREADLVVQGRVLWTRVEPLRDRPWASQTRATVAVWRVFKAAPGAPARPDLVQVLLPGGTRAGLTTRAPGVPTLRPGDELLLLLQRVPGGFTPLGYGLGVRLLPRVGGRPARLPVDVATALEGHQ